MASTSNVSKEAPDHNSSKIPSNDESSPSGSVDTPQLDKHRSALSLFVRDTYAIYVGAIITFVYASNQLNRYILTSVSLDLEREVGFGDGDGESFLYAMLTGPITTLPYCAGSIMFGHLGDNFNQVYLVVFISTVSSIAHAMMAFARTYWLLALLRGVSIFVAAGYVSLGPAIIADFFPQEVRGIAIGVFGWGQPIGQGLVFALGNGLTAAYDYKVALFAAGIYIIPFCILMLFTVNENRAKYRKSEEENDDDENKKLLNKTDGSTHSVPDDGIGQHVTVKETIRLIVTNKVLLAMYCGGAFKYMSSLNWQFFRNQFFINYHGMTSSEVAAFMSWIPIVGGIPGAIVFGWISDQLVKNGWGALARLGVVAGMHTLAIPMIAGVVFSPVNGAFAFVFFDEVLQRYFISGISTAIIHMVPAAYRVSALGYGWMFYWLIGGNSTLLSPIISDALDPERDGVDSNGVGLQRALTVLYLGGMVCAASFFCLGTYWFYTDQTSKGVVFGPGRYRSLVMEDGDLDKPSKHARTVSIDGEDVRGVVQVDRSDTPHAGENTGERQSEDVFGGTYASFGGDRTRGRDDSLKQVV